MIGMLTGKIYNQNKNPVIIDVGGVGYTVYVPDRLRAKLTLHQEISLSIHTHVTDDAIALYGFGSDSEMTLFELLLTVSGIGPRTSLAIIDRGVASIQKAIIDSDVDFFTTIPRLGKKNAQKIIIELKSKIGSARDLDLGAESEGETKELLEALQSMGFDRKEILHVIKKLDPSLSTIEQKIRQSLKLLG